MDGKGGGRGKEWSMEMGKSRSTHTRIIKCTHACNDRPVFNVIQPADGRSGVGLASRVYAKMWGNGSCLTVVDLTGRFTTERSRGE